MTPLPKVRESRSVHNARQYLESRLHSLSPHSAEEYFMLLLSRALQAKSAGNYAIAAALVFECAGMQIVSFGSSRLYSEQDPLGHAEINAIQGAHRLARASGRTRPNVTLWTNAQTVAASDGQVFIRPCKERDRPSATLYTTLEPCPMCTVAILNARINRVVVALPDEAGGSLAPERLGMLPHIWAEMARQHELSIQFVGKALNDESGLMVPDELIRVLEDLFLDGRERLDSKIIRDGVLAMEEACSVGQEVWRREGERGGALGRG
jgi:tRNA(Arg) A34 adenosine deaminase TadA